MNALSIPVIRNDGGGLMGGWVVLSMYGFLCGMMVECVWGDGARMGGGEWLGVVSVVCVVVYMCCGSCVYQWPNVTGTSCCYI